MFSSLSYSSNSISVVVNTYSLSLSLSLCTCLVQYQQTNLSILTNCWLLCCFDLFCRIFFIFCVFFMGPLWIMQDDICKYINFDTLFYKAQVAATRTENSKVTLEKQKITWHTSSKTPENQTTKKYQLFGEAWASDPNMFLFFLCFLSRSSSNQQFRTSLASWSTYYFRKMWNTKKVVVIHTEGHDREWWTT